jgi:hypothetical protein
MQASMHAGMSGIATPTGTLSGIVTLIGMLAGIVISSGTEAPTSEQPSGNATFFAQQTSRFGYTPQPAGRGTNSGTGQGREENMKTLCAVYNTVGFGLLLPGVKLLLPNSAESVY